MRKVIYGGIAISVVSLLISNPALAQVGGGASGGSSSRATSPAAAPPQAANRNSTFVGPVSPTITNVSQVFDTARYLNAGDYGGAYSAMAALRADQYNATHQQGTAPNPNNPTVNTNRSGNFQVFTGLMAQDRNTLSERFSAPAGDIMAPSGQVYNGAEPLLAQLGSAASSQFATLPDRQLYNGTRIPMPSQPSSAPGSRPMSGLETAQNRMVRENLIPTLTVNVSMTQALLAAANETGRADFIDRAQSLLSDAQLELTQARQVVTMIDQFQGRAFANSSEANLYLTARAYVQGRNTNILPAGAQHILEEMRTAYDGTLSGAGPINRETRARLEARINESNALNSRLDDARENVASPTTPADAAAARARFGDSVNLLPTPAQLIQMANRNVQNNNQPVQHTLTDLNPPPQGSNNNSNNGGAVQAAANANSAINGGNAPNTTPQQQANNSPTTPAPIVMPRQPDGRVPYPTYQGPSQAELDRRHAAAQAAARQVDPNSQTGQTVTTAQVPDTTGDDNSTAADTSATDAATGGHVEVTPYNATDGAIAGVEAARQAAADAAAARAAQGNSRNLATSVVNTAIANTRQITGGGSFQAARVASIYQGYNVNGGNASATVHGTGPSSAGTSLSAAGYSLSAAGVSPSSAGRSNSAGGNVGFSYAGVGGVSSASNGFSLVTQGLSLATYGFSLAGGPFVAGDLGLSDPAMRGLGANDISNPWAFAPAPRNRDVAAATLRGAFQLQNDPSGRFGRETGGIVVANLLDDQTRNMNELVSNGIGGLDALLAQPFNVVLTWGANAYDIDLHMTGPTGEGQTDRFHIYFADRGSQTAFPFAELIKDCICNSGSEVILTAKLIRGGVYRISAFNFGDQSTTSFNLSDLSDAEIYIVRGGTATAQGNGTTIVGGRVIYRGRVPRGRAGNTWNAVEIDARTGRITAPNIVGNSGGSGSVN